MPGDGLAPNGAMPSTGTMMIKFGIRIYTVPNLQTKDFELLDIRSSKQVTLPGQN